MQFSTDRPLTFAFEQIPDAEFQAHLEIPAKEVKKVRAQRLREQHDPQSVAKLLEGLPAPTLYVLGAVARARGFMMVSDLARELDGSLKRLDVELALAPAFAAFIAVPVESRWQPGTAVMLVAPAAEHVTRLLAQIDVVDLDPHAAFEPDPGDDGRVLFALCAALVQVDVKLTNDDRPHRTALKRLSKQIGLTEADLESRILSARFAGLLEPDLEGVLRPNVDVLERAACGHYAPGTLPGEIAGFLAKHGPALPLEVVERWGREVGVAAVPKALGRLPGFTLGKVADVRAIRWEVPPTPAAAAHVTPSFEVFLPPEASTANVVHAVAVSELARIDRMIVARVTKASIEIACARGLAPLSLLRGVCRTPLPQNVEAAILDWIGNTTIARTAVGRVLVVEPQHDERAASALASFGPRRLAMGVFVVDAAVSLSKLESAVSRLGIHCHTTTTPERAAKPLALPPLPEPSTRRLRQRVGAWRADQPFEGQRDSYLVTARKRWETHGKATLPSGTSKGNRLDGVEIEELLTDWELDADYVLQDHEWRAAETALSAMDRARALAILEGPLPRTRKRDLGIDLIARLMAVAPPGALLDAGAHDAPAIDRNDGSLVWVRSNLLPQLQEAARRGISLVIERDDGKLESVRVTRVAQQGSLWMILGERTADDLGVAYPLNRITALAHDSRAAAPALAVRGAMAGHLPCPCGSGQRYRQCCRPAQ